MDGTRVGRTVRSCSARAASGLASRSWAVRIVSGLLISSSMLRPAAAAAQTQPIPLEGFIITGTPVPLAVGTETNHVTVLDGDALRLDGAVTVGEALSRVPGVGVVRNGSFGSVTSIFLRGAESDQVKILVDGVEVNQAGGAYDLAGLLVSDVERIEVSRGPASALYGSDAMAGVIQVFTRRGRGPLHGSLTARAGNYGRVETSASVSGAAGAGSYALTAGRVSSDGILAFNNRSANTVLSGLLTLVPDEATSVRLSGRYSDRVFHFPTDGSGAVVDRNAFSYGDETSLAVDVERRLSGIVGLRGALTTYSWDGGSDDRPDGPADTLGAFGFTSLDAFRRSAADIRATIGFGEGSTMSAGVELEEERQRSFSESLSEGGASTGRSRFRRVNRGYYAHLVSREGRWLGTLGGRLEDNEQYGRFFTYQAGLSFSWPATGTRVRGSLGRGLKEPTFLETSAQGYTVGNPDLEPERSLAWEAGVEQTFGDGGASVSLTWFHQDLRDLIQYTFLPPEPGGANYYNVAAASADGVEAEGVLPLGPLLLSGGYTYLRSRVDDAGFDEGPGAVFVEGERLIRRPEHQGTLDAVYRFSLGELSGGVRWIGSRSDRDFRAWPSVPVELPAYTLLRAGAEVQVLKAAASRPGLSVRVSAENLFDQGYEQVFGYAAPGRSFLVGGRVTFGGPEGGS